MSQKMFEHVTRVYDAMASSAEDTPEGRIWRGHLTRLVVDELGYPSSYYSRILGYLRRMGCVERISRGGGSGEGRTDSFWQVLHRPTRESFEAVYGQRSAYAPSSKALYQMVKDQNERIANLEAIIQDALQNL